MLPLHTHSLAQCSHVDLLQWAVVCYSQSMFRSSKELVWVKLLLGFFHMASLRDQRNMKDCFCDQNIERKEKCEEKKSKIKNQGD